MYNDDSLLASQLLIHFQCPFAGFDIPFKSIIFWGWIRVIGLVSLLARELEGLCLLIKVITCQTHERAMISSVLTDSPLWPTVGVVSEFPLESPRDMNEEMSLRLFYTWPIIHIHILVSTMKKPFIASNLWMARE